MSEAVIGVVTLTVSGVLGWEGDLFLEITIYLYLVELKFASCWWSRCRFHHYYPVVDGRSQQVYRWDGTGLYCQRTMSCCHQTVVNLRYKLINESGPSIKPCGTPDDTGKILENEPFTQTYRVCERKQCASYLMIC